MIYIWIKLKVFNNKEDRSLLSLENKFSIN